MTILAKPKPERKPAPVPAGIPGNWLHVGATAKAVLAGLEDMMHMQARRCRQVRWLAERKIGAPCDHDLSRLIDRLLIAEEALRC